MKNLFVLTLLCAGLLMAQETTSLMDLKLWSSPFKTATITQKGDAIVVKGSSEVSINTRFTCDPEALYKFSAMIRSDVKKGSVRMALRMFDSRKREIAVVHYANKNDSLTEVVENAPKGATMLKLKDISKWNKALYGNCGLAFNAKEDFSDLPNFMIVPLQIADVKQEEGFVTLNLKRPITVDLRAGTKVRQHYYGGASYYTPFVPIATEWKPVNGHAEGVRSGNATTPKTFAPGTAEFAITFYFPGVTKDQTVELKDVKLVLE